MFSKSRSIKKLLKIYFKDDSSHVGRDFIIGSIAVFICILLFGGEGDSTFYYDETAYIGLGDIFNTGGLFNFKNFALENNFIRGYLFPWIIAVFRIHPNHLFIWRILTSMMGAGICTIAIPLIFKNFGFACMKTGAKFLCLLLFCIFYWGTIINVLSDMWGAGFMLFGIVFLILTNNIQNSIGKMVILGILSGILVGGAYNIRTIYIFGVYGVIALLILQILCNAKQRKVGILVCICFILGVLIISFPQIIINYYQYGLITPKVITGQGDGLFASQLYWGIEMQKYETYIGGDFQPNTIYPDVVGQVIQGTLNTEQTIVNYVKLLLQHPIDFLGLYFRHFLNMLDIRHPEVYIKNLNGSILYPLINYTILYIFTISFGIKLLAKEMRLLLAIKKGKYIIILLIPTMAIIPGAVETRFAIMIHLLLYGFVASVVKWKSFVLLSVQRKIVLLVGYVIFLAMIASICGTTVASLEYLPLLY